MPAADHRLAHFKAIVEKEATAAGGSDRHRYRAAYKAIAAATGLEEEYVYQLFKGHKAKIGDAAAAKIERAYSEGRERGWMDQPRQPEAAGPESFEQRRPPTVEEAVETIAELLLGLDEDGRAHASTTLSNLARSPQRGAAKTAEMLVSLLKIHPREPDPTSPSPSPLPASANQARAPGKARLTVKEGGGHKMQLDLPLRRALAPARDPFNVENAPANERLWYERVRAAPKAKS